MFYSTRETFFSKILQFSVSVFTDFSANLRNSLPCYILSRSICIRSRSISRLSAFGLNCLAVSSVISLLTCCSSDNYCTRRDWTNNLELSFWSSGYVGISRCLTLLHLSTELEFVSDFWIGGKVAALWMGRILPVSIESGNDANETEWVECHLM